MGGGTNSVTPETTVVTPEPEPIPTVVGATYDPSKINTLFQDVEGTKPVTENGQSVMLVKDLSGNKLHATATSVATAPTYKDGRLVFDGVDDYLVMPSARYFAADGSISAFAQFHLTAAPTGTNSFSIIDDDDGVTRSGQLLVALANSYKTILFSKTNSPFELAASGVPATSLYNMGMSTKDPLAGGGGKTVDLYSASSEHLDVSVTSTSNTTHGQQFNAGAHTLEIGRRKTGTQYSPMELGRVEVRASGNVAGVKALCSKYSK